jgi:hypothetical protein
MKQTVKVHAVLVALSLAGVMPEACRAFAAAPAASNDVPALVARLQDKSVSWQERKEIEAQLKAANRAAVLPAMFGLLAKFREGGDGFVQVFYGTSPYAKGESLSWHQQTYVIATEVWAFHTEAGHDQDDDLELNRIMLPLLTTNLPGARRELAVAVIHRASPRGWSDELEGPLVGMFRDPKCDFSGKAAGRLLLKVKREKYFAEVRERAADKRAPLDFRKDLMLEVLAAGPVEPTASRGRKVMHPDVQTAKICFELIQELETQRPGGGWSLAQYVGSRLGVNFRADPWLTEGGNRLSAAQTSTNALSWWATNKATFKGHLLQAPRY